MFKIFGIYLIFVIFFFPQNTYKTSFVTFSWKATPRHSAYIFIKISPTFNPIYLIKS
jgi:hypothetical protein